MLLAGCSPSIRWVGPADTSAPSASADSSPSASAGGVVWKDCSSQARQLAGKLVNGLAYDCGSLQVPADWHNPADGTQFTIALMRVRTKTSSGAHIGSLVVNPGGPGGSGIELASYLPLELPSEIPNSFDLVGFDPRGVGASTPAIDCISDSTLDQVLGFDPDPQTQEQFDALTNLWKGAGRSARTSTARRCPCSPPSRRPGTLTRSARRSAMTSSPTWATPTARCSARCTPSCSRPTSGRWCSTARSTRR